MGIAVSTAIVIVACMGLAAHVSAATSQDDIDEAKRVQQLEESRKATAEARRATAEAEAAEAKAKLGSLDTSKFTKPTGEAKSLNVEGIVLAYGAVDRIAAGIAAVVAPRAAASASAPGRPIVLLGDKEFSALQQAKSFKHGVTLLSDAMSRLRVPALAADDPQCKEPTLGGAGLGVLGSIDVALQIAQLFKVDKKFEGADVSIDDFALASSVMSKLSSLGVRQVVYAPVYLAGTFGGPDPFSSSDIAKGLHSLGDGQNSVDIQIAEIARRREKLKAREDDQKVKLPEICKAAFDSARRTYTALETTGKNLKERAEKLLAVAATADEKTGTTLLHSLVQAESMEKNLNGAAVLRLKPIAGGGTTYTKTSLFSTRIGIGGGAVVAYMLIDGVSGTVELSGTAAEYGGFVQPQDLTGYLATQRAESATPAGAPGLSKQ